jgi:hypothetical protein
MFIARFMKIAAKPKITITSFIKGNVTATLSPVLVTGFFISSHEKKANNKNEILQINATLEKNTTTFMFGLIISTSLERKYPKQLYNKYLVSQKTYMAKHSQQNNINLCIKRSNNVKCTQPGFV